MMLNSRFTLTSACAFIIGVGAFVKIAEAAELSLPTVLVATGQTQFASIQYRSQKDAVSIIQFDLEYDQEALNIALSAGDALLASGKSLYTHSLPNGRVRVLLVGINQTVIADGSLIELSIQMRSPAKGKRAYRIDIVDVVGGSPSAQSVVVKSKSGEVVNVGSANQ